MTSSESKSPNQVQDVNSESETLEDSASTSATTDEVPSFGWSSYAERVNGRFAMIGFIALLFIEAFSKDTFLHWAGLVR